MEKRTITVIANIEGKIDVHSMVDLEEKRQSRNNLFSKHVNHLRVNIDKRNGTERD